jgi:predicted GNAT family acetyltransferase
MENNASLSRFENTVDGYAVFASYVRDGDVIAIHYVEAHPNLRGSGAAGQLMVEIMDYAKAHNLKIYPICSYAVAWMNRHPEYDAVRVDRD